MKNGTRVTVVELYCCALPGELPCWDEERELIEAEKAKEGGGGIIIAPPRSISSLNGAEILLHTFDAG